MKEVCGYKGLNGQFYEKKEACEKADLEFKIEGIETRLRNFSNEVSQYMYKHYRDTYRYGISTYDVQREILNTVAKAVLQNKEDFLDVIKQGENLKEELSSLEKKYNDDYNKPWWLRIKWWE